MNVRDRSAARAGAPPEAQALTIGEAAALLQVSERTIKRYRAQGILPRSKRLGVARIPLSAITALLAGETTGAKLRVVR